MGIEERENGPGREQRFVYVFIEPDVDELVTSATSLEIEFSPNSTFDDTDDAVYTTIEGTRYFDGTTTKRRYWTSYHNELITNPFYTREMVRGTRIYVRARLVNSHGSGEWSDTAMRNLR